MRPDHRPTVGFRVQLIIIVIIINNYSHNEISARKILLDK
jgi:hypothetical protein